MQHPSEAKDVGSLDSAAGLKGPYYEQYMLALSSLACVDPFTRLTEVLAEDVGVLKVDNQLIAKRDGVHSSQYSYAQYLEEEDIRSIRECIREVTVQSIIPWMEARVREWNETHMQSRKGVAAKLLAAGRKFFGSGSLTGTPTPRPPLVDEV